MSVQQPAANGIAPRRRPRQSRAVHTAQALQEAFVRLLVERGYAAITIREIVAIAGTGLGSFYEYFASKDDLARVCVHLRSKALLAALRDAVARQRGASFATILDAIVDSQIEAHRAAPREWGAHYMLERHVSSPETYQKMYERFVEDWCVALNAASDLRASATTREVACVSHAILYGLFAHTHITAAGGAIDAVRLRHQVRTAVLGHVLAVGMDAPVTLT